MKTLAFFALSLVASAAMATSPVGPGAIEINGTSNQQTSISGAIVSNKADGADAQAQQNLASNVGKVKVNTSNQTVTVQAGALLSNFAGNDAVAQQSLSSNVGDVTVAGVSTQNTIVGPLAAVLNSSYGRDALAVQNISSNNACFTCK